MAKISIAPLGAPLLDSSGYLSKPWVQWFNSITIATGEGLVLLNTLEASSLNYIEITTNINSTYGHYRLQLCNLKGSIAGSLLGILVSVDGGITYRTGPQDYEYVINTNNGSNTASSDVESDVLYLMSTGISSDIDSGRINGYIDFFSPSSDEVYKTFIWNLAYEDSSGVFMNIVGSGRFNNISAIDTLRITVDTGYLTDGSIRLYGIK